MKTNEKGPREIERERVRGRKRESLAQFSGGDPADQFAMPSGEEWIFNLLKRAKEIRKVFDCLSANSI